VLTPPTPTLTTNPGDALKANGAAYNADKALSSFVLFCGCRRGTPWRGVLPFIPRA
jgi:hypothetical protein